MSNDPNQISSLFLDHCAVFSDISLERSLHHPDHPSLVPSNVAMLQCAIIIGFFAAVILIACK